MKQSDLSIRVALMNYTGLGRRQDADVITSDPTIMGHVPRERVHKLRARFHGAGSDVDITSLIQPSGDFILDQRELERIREDRLDDGLYALHLDAEDEYGTTLASTDIAFTLATTPPQPLLFDPPDDGQTNLQLGFLDVAFLDVSGIDPSSISPDNIALRNADRTLPVTRAEPTTDGLVRYYYEEQLRDGPVEVLFKAGRIADLAGNLVEVQRTFEFTSAQPMFNGVPQRSSRLQVEPIVNPAYNEDSGASVFLHSGEAFLRRVDLEIPGRGFDFRFERTYRSAWIKLPLGQIGTPLGHKWDFSYNRRLVVVTGSNRAQIHLRFPDARLFEVVRMDGRGREDLYRTTEGKQPYISPPGSYTRLIGEGDRFIELDRHGNTISYERDTGSDGTVFPMSSFTDRNGNTMTFEYVDGQLKYVIDTLGRRIEFFYNDQLLTKIRDFIGREITFSLTQSNAWKL